MLDPVPKATWPLPPLPGGVRALEGVRVLDLSRFIAGPHCAMLLADLGADVIKIETPKGDQSRNLPPHVGGESLFYMVFNRNKQGMTLDLWRDEGRALLRELVAESDVLIENFRPGVMAGMGCSYDDLRRINPRLVMVSISGYGQDGPWSERGCFDAIAQASCGLMSVTGWPDGPPTLGGTFIADYLTAVYAAFGTVVALHHRERSGEGQWLDVALMDASVTALATHIPAHLMLGTVADRRGNRDRYIAPVNAFGASDGHVFVSVATDAHFLKLLRLVGRCDLAGDPRYASASARVAHAAEVEALVQGIVGPKTCAEAVAAFEGAGIPVAKVATIDEVATNPQVAHRGLIERVHHPTAGDVPLPGTPLKLSATPGGIRAPPPRLGEHNREILARVLGYCPERIDALDRDGVI